MSSSGRCHRQVDLQGKYLLCAAQRGYKETSLLRRVKAHTLTNATPPIVQNPLAQQNCCNF